MSKTITSMAFLGLIAVTPAFAQTPSAQGNTGQSATGQGQPHDAHTQANTSAQGTTGTGTGMARGNGQLSSQDQKFVLDAAQGGMMEVELGRTAGKNASSSDVKSFGQRMVTDHTKANTKLMTLASNKGVDLPRTLPTDKQKDRDKMAGLSGAEFDRMYIQHMVKDHDKTIALFETQAQKGTDADLRAFAQETLPTLREHKTMVDSLASKLGVKASK